jgi:hypothetical protein
LATSLRRWSSLGRSSRRRDRIHPLPPLKAMAKKQNLSVKDIMRMTPLEILDWLSTQPSGKKPPKKRREPFSETLANRLKKREEAAERKRTALEHTTLAAMRKRGRVYPHPRNQPNAVLCALEPGAWYGRPDIERSVPHLPHRGVQFIVADLWKKGFLERTANPAFDQGRAQGRQLEPRYLYRMTRKGLSRRLEALPFFKD